MAVAFEHQQQTTDESEHSFAESGTDNDREWWSSRGDRYFRGLVLRKEPQWLCQNM